MHRFLVLTILLVSLVCQLPAQQPAYYEALATYKDATELFDKAKYSPAQQKFGVFLNQTNQSSVPEQVNDLRSEAKFHQALCAFHLLRNNTQALFEEFIRQYPSHTRVNESWYYMGKLHFIKREYKDVIPYLEEFNGAQVSRDKANDANYMLGYSYYHQKDLDKAMPLFYALSRSQNEHKEDASYYYAVIQYSRGNYEQAYNGFRGMENPEKYDRNVPVYIANCLLKLEKYDELDDYGQELSKKGNLSKEMMLVLGNAAFEQENWSRCIEYFEEYGAGKLDRASKYRLGFSFFQSGKFEEAEKQFSRILRPEDEMAQNALYYLGHCKIKADDLEGAKLAFRKASAIEENARIQEEALFQYGKAAFQNADFQEAHRAFQQLEEDFPNSEYNGEAQSFMGEILLNSSDFQAAIDYFEKSDLRNERSRKAYQRACFFYGLDQFEKAQYDNSSIYFKKALNLNYNLDLTLSSYFWYAESQFNEGEYAEAVDYYSEYLDHPRAHKHEDYSRAFYGMAWAQFKQKNYRGASRNFEKFIALSNKNEAPELYVDAFLRAGDCEFIQKRWDNALSYYRQVRDFNYRNADYALFQVGQTYFRKGDYRNSANAYEEIVSGYKKSDFHDDAQLQLCRIYLSELQEWDKTVKYGKMLVDDHPNSTYVPEAYYMMGFAEMYSNNNASAVRHFKRVVLDYCDNDVDRTFDVLTILVGIMDPGDYDKLERDVKKKCPVLQQGGNPRGAQILFTRIENAFFEDDFQTVIKLGNEFFGDYPGAQQRYDVWYFRGRSYEALEQEDQALADYREVYSSNPINSRSMEAFSHAGDIQFERGNYMISMELFTQMEEKSEDHIDEVMAQFGLAKNHMKLEEYGPAKQVLLKIHSDPNTTQYSRDRSYVQIGNCEYFLGDLGRAEQIFTEIEKNYTNVFAAESQYMICRILYDNGKYQEAIDGSKKFKTEYPGYNYWKAKTFMVVAESYLELGNMFQARGGLEILASQDDFPDIRAEAVERLAELDAMDPGITPGDSLNNGEGGRP